MSRLHRHGNMASVFYYIGMKYGILVVIHCKNADVFEGTIAFIKLCKIDFFIFKIKIKIIL